MVKTETLRYFPMKRNFKVAVATKDYWTMNAEQLRYCQRHKIGQEPYKTFWGGVL